VPAGVTAGTTGTNINSLFPQRPTLGAAGNDRLFMIEAHIEGTDWISLGINPWAYNVDQKTYAEFSKATLPGTIGGTVTDIVVSCGETPDELPAIFYVPLYETQLGG
jgi:hypothetical protein